MIGDHKMWAEEEREAAVSRVGEEVLEAREEREARKGRVLVVLDRAKASRWVSDAAQPDDLIENDIADALLRDREEQVEMIGDAVARLLPTSVRAVTPERIARAVLAALEGVTE